MLFRNKVLTNFFFAFLIEIGFIFIFSHQWIFDFFGDYVGYSEILFYLSTGINFIKTAPVEVINSFFYNVLLKSIVSTCLVIFLYLLIYTYQIKFFTFIKKINILENNTKSILILIFFLFSIMYFGYGFNFHKIIFKKYDDKIYFVKNYQDPQKLIYKKPKKFKNLIFIYFESAEKDLPNFSLKTFRDGLIEEYLDSDHVYKSLKNLDGYEINNFVQAESLGWSMAGMAASQCGVPIYNLNRTLKNKNSNKNQCIGDVLKQMGYNQYFFTGGNKDFQQMDDFYLKHGFDKIYGRSDYLANGLNQEFFNSWSSSLNDEMLFSQVLKKIEEIKNDDKPFNITLITSDTHDPFSYFSPICNKFKKFGNKFDDNYYFNLRMSFTCSSNIIFNFINELKSEKIFENTLIVISGDHLIPNNERSKIYFPIKEKINDPLANRRIFFKVINSKNLPSRNLMSHFDIPSTILNDLNILDLNEEKFGLGLSLYSRHNVQKYFKDYHRIIRASDLAEILNEKLKSEN